MNIEVLHCSGIFHLWLGFREKTDEKNTITKIIVFFCLFFRENLTKGEKFRYNAKLHYS